MNHIGKKINTIKAINRGTKYLFKACNNDGGVKYPDDKGTDIGIWVTAEALEALLSSKALPLPSYEGIKPMIDILIQYQNQDGSWNVLFNQKAEPSSISTGHCIYALKLSLIGNYQNSKDKSKIKNAIKKGEKWLHSNYYEKDGYAFWTAGPKVDDTSIDPNIDETSRIDIIMSTFYAVMGIITPRGNIVNNDDGDGEGDGDEDKTIKLISKIKDFLLNQADYFSNRYESGFEKGMSISSSVNGVLLSKEQIAEELKIEQSKLISTICRIINSLYILKEESSKEVKNRINKLNAILRYVINPFMTSFLPVKTNSPQECVNGYTNNTPFDMANALFNIGYSSDFLNSIIDTYLARQNEDGSWFLYYNTVAFRVKTWTTAEAIIVLNRALDKYIEFEINDIKNSVKKIKRNNYFVISFLILSFITYVYSESICSCVTKYFPSIKESIINAIPTYVYPTVLSIIGILFPIWYNERLTSKINKR